MLKPSILALALLGLCAPALAQQGPAPTDAEANVSETGEGAAPAEAEDLAVKAFNASLTRKTGDVMIANGQVTLHVPQGFYYLTPEDAKRVLEEAWGNPPEDLTEGMLFPAHLSPTDATSWGVVVTFEETGYVSDKDAAKINYDDLIKDMRDGQEQANAELSEMGYSPMHVVGWAAAPRYDAQTHKLYWAKELSVDDMAEHTLNYDMRVLGRKGVLSLNFVAAMESLAEIEAASPAVLAIPEFNEGFRYADYNPKTDAKADFGVAGLIAGGALGAAVAKKAGVLGIVLLFLKKGWMLIAAAVAGIGGWLRRMFASKSA